MRTTYHSRHSNEDALDDRIFVRLSAADKRHLRKLARDRRTDISAVVRELIITAIRAAAAQVKSA